METIFKVFETVFDVLVYVVFGFVGFILLLFLLAIIFGKRVVKKWEYEANFYDEKKRELGEFDIELKKFAKEEGDFKLEAKFKLKHSALMQGRVVQVYLDDILVMEGIVEKEGRIYLKNEHLKSEVESPESGQICRVMCSSVELCSEAIKKD